MVILATNTLLAFLFLYPLASAIAIILIGPMGLISAIFSVLQVSRTMTALVAMITYLPYVQGAVFDAVISKESKDDIVLHWKLHRRREERTQPMLRSKIIAVANFIRFRGVPFVFREIAYCLLGLIPFAGFPLVLYFKASRKGNRTHRRYYELMEWDRLQVAKFYKLHKGDYTMFGVVALTLEMIPGFNVFFMFTSNIGLALWTVKMHSSFSGEME